MKLFKDLSNNPDDVKVFKEKELEDDRKVKAYFDNCDHKRFLIALMKLGTLVDIITTYLDFLKPQINEALQLDNSKKDRKINKYIRDLNERVNNEYGFDKDNIIVEQCILFDGELYLFFNKSQFLKQIELLEIQ